MNYFRRLRLTIDVPEFDMSACRLAQILNVSKPHAVRMSDANLRSCISFSFRRLKFDELESLLLKNGE